MAVVSVPALIWINMGYLFLRWGDNFRSSACSCARVFGTTCSSLRHWCQDNIYIHWFFQVLFFSSYSFLILRVYVKKMFIKNSLLDFDNFPDMAHRHMAASE